MSCADFEMCQRMNMFAFILMCMKQANLEHAAYQLVNSLRPSDAICYHRTLSALIQAITCRRFGTKPWPKPILTNIVNRTIKKKNLSERLFSDILIKTEHFPINEIYLKMSSAKQRLFCWGLNVLSYGQYLDRVVVSYYDGTNSLCVLAMGLPQSCAEPSVKPRSVKWCFYGH